MQWKLEHLLPSQRFITFFSLKISALDIVSGQKSARCNQSFPVNLHVINVREVSSQFSCLYIKKGEKSSCFWGNSRYYHVHSVMAGSSQPPARITMIKNKKVHKYLFLWLKAQFYIQLVYTAPLLITLKIWIWVSNIRKHDL